MIWMFIVGIILPCLLVPPLTSVFVLGVSLVLAGAAYGFELISAPSAIEATYKIAALTCGLLGTGYLAIRRKSDSDSELRALDLVILLWAAAFCAFFVGAGALYFYAKSNTAIERSMTVGTLAAPLILTLFGQPAKFLFKSDGLSFLTGAMRFNYVWWLVWMPMMRLRLPGVTLEDVAWKYGWMAAIAIFAGYLIVEGAFITHEPETKDRSRKRLLITSIFVDFTIGTYLIGFLFDMLVNARGTDADITWPLFGFGSLLSIMWIRGFFLAGHFLNNTVKEGEPVLYGLHERFNSESYEMYGGFWTTSFNAKTTVAAVAIFAAVMVANEMLEFTSRAGLLNYSILIEPFLVAGLRKIWPAEPEMDSADDLTDAA
jgi:hypothetical protein